MHQGGVQVVLQFLMFATTAGGHGEVGVEFQEPTELICEDLALFEPDGTQNTCSSVRRQKEAGQKVDGGVLDLESGTEVAKEHTRTRTHVEETGSVQVDVHLGLTCGEVSHASAGGQHDLASGGDVLG